MIVPFPPGGVADITGRPVAHVMGRLLKQSVVVVNKAGAGGSVGAAQAARAAPDGYTILMALSSISVLPVADRLQGRPPAYELDQFAPDRADQRRSHRARGERRRSLQDAEGSGRRGEGQARHDQLRLVGRLRHPARGDGDLRRGGRHQAVPHSLPGRRTGGGGAARRARSTRWPPDPSAAIGQIKAGKMRALAVWGDKRLASMPDVPSMKELGYDATFYIWSGLFAPAATPQPVMTPAARRGEAHGRGCRVQGGDGQGRDADRLSRRAGRSRPSSTATPNGCAIAVERIGKVPEN